jgi:hypothetical protein
MRVPSDHSVDPSPPFSKARMRSGPSCFPCSMVGTVWVISTRPFPHLLEIPHARQASRSSAGEGDRDALLRNRLLRVQRVLRIQMPLARK